MNDQSDFRIEISETELPAGWTVEKPHDSVVHLHAPDGTPEKVFVQYWDDTDHNPDEPPRYLVQLMVDSSLDSVSLELNGSISEQFKSKANAVEYAISVARAVGNTQF